MSLIVLVARHRMNRCIAGCSSRLAVGSNNDPTWGSEAKEHHAPSQYCGQHLIEEFPFLRWCAREKVPMAVNTNNVDAIDRMASLSQQYANNHFPDAVRLHTLRRME